MLSVKFLGSGDAFGSGGRMQACILLREPRTGLATLLDCGASSLVAMKRQGVDPAEIDTVLVTHLHGDHFGGLPFLILDAQFSRRVRPLTIAGPPGTEQRLRATMEALFPGSSSVERRFPVTVRELDAATPYELPAGSVAAFEVLHASGAPAYALRVETGAGTVAYSGDTEWTDTLVEVADGADLFICEAYFFEKRIPHHLDYATLRDHLSRLGCKRIILTHLSADMLTRLGEVELACAEDGTEVTL